MCVLCVALFVLVMALPVLATETRVMTMGDQHMFIQDDYNIWSWTSTVNNYPRHLIVDHNDAGWSGSASRVGMIVPFMKNAVVGAFFSDDYVPTDFSWYWPNQKLDLFYGYRGTNFDLGIHADWWGDKAEQGTAKQSTSIVGLQAGIGFNANGNMLEFDAGFKKLSYAYEPIATFGDSTLNDDGSSMFRLAGRYMYAYNNMVTLVPAIGFETWKDKNLAAQEVKYTNVEVGVGCNTVPMQGTEFLTSIGVSMDKFEAQAGGTTTADENFTVLPFVKFGADIQVKPWLNFRVGAEKWIQATYEDKLADQKETHPSFNYELGVGIMVGDVQFDAVLEKDWLNAGPYFLSGEDEGNMFPKISFKYDYR
jgi:hypothetical protein